MAGPKAPEQVERLVRFTFPVQVSFESESFVLSDFTANLSMTGLFLPTDRDIPVGTRGSLTFRLSPWDNPFTVEAEVVRSVDSTHQTSNQPTGLGIRFVELTPVDVRRLRRLVEGIQDGSVTQAIRRAIAESGLPLQEELRSRSVDQKVIFALSAQGTEIEDLIKDGQVAVISRLLRNPRIGVPHVRLILQERSMPARLLLEIRRNANWMADQECCLLFCRHPLAPVQEVLSLLPRFSEMRFKELLRDPHLRPQIKVRIKQLLSSRR